MARIRSALFLDFDNIFGGLLGLDREAAVRLATDPSQLLDRLVHHGLPDGQHRDLLLRRAYLNPAGRLVDEGLGNDSGWLYLQRFRPYLTRAGFEVIDCPSLTTAHKNAADIRIVIDVLTSLEGGAPLDEVIIASSDADFSPLLQRLRAGDLRTCIITAGTTAPAYAAIAHQHLDEEEVIQLLLGEVTTPPTHEVEHEAPAGSPGTDGTDGGDDPAPTPTPGLVGTSGPADVEAAGAAATALVRQQVADAPAALHLGALGNVVHQQVGSAPIRDSRWFGAGTLAAFVGRSVPGIVVSSHHAWDPERHEPPVSAGQPAAPDLVEQLHALTDLPRLPAEVWPVLFEVLAEHLDGQGFSLSGASAWARDELARRGIPVGRQHVAFAIKGAHWGGAPMAGGTPPTADDLRSALLANLVSRSAASGLALTEDQQAAIHRLLQGEAPEPRPAPTA